MRTTLAVAAISAAILLVIVGLTLLTVWLATRKDALDYVGDIRVVELDEKYTSVIDKTDSYLGHPDFVVNDEGKLIVAYPAGHGKGAIIMKESSDFGDTWSERISDLPQSFEKSQETPTLYNLRFSDGSSKLLLVSGCPSWAEDDEYYADGFNCSISSFDESKSSSTFPSVTFDLAVRVSRFAIVIFKSAIVSSVKISLTFLFVSVNVSAALYCQSIKSDNLIGSIIVYGESCFL